MSGIKQIGTALYHTETGKKEQVAILQVFKNSPNVYIRHRSGKLEMVEGFLLSHWTMRGGV